MITALIFVGLLMGISAWIILAYLWHLARRNGDWRVTANFNSIGEAIAEGYLIHGVIALLLAAIGAALAEMA